MQFQFVMLLPINVMFMHEIGPIQEELFLYLQSYDVTLQWHHMYIMESQSTSN